MLPANRPAIMGILNVTPDSFSDGGRFLTTGAAIGHAHRMIEEGADILDIGGESTRPGSEPVPADEELRRVLPVLRGLENCGVPLSIDTSKPIVAREALAAGATVVNDVSGLRDEEMIHVCAESGCHVCIMHMLGTPRTMQAGPQYGNVVAEVRDSLLGSAGRAQSAGVANDRIWIDPGFGFGKTVAHNLQLLMGLGALVATGYPVLVGVSRKSFLGKVLGTAEHPASIEHREDAALAAHTLAQMQGARLIRTHEVGRAVRAASLVAAALAEAKP